MVQIVLVTVMFHALPTSLLPHRPYRQEATTMSKTPRPAGSPPLAGPRTPRQAGAAPGHQGDVGSRLPHRPRIRPRGPGPPPVRHHFRRRRDGGCRDREHLRVHAARVRSRGRRADCAARRTAGVRGRPADRRGVDGGLRLCPGLLAAADLPGPRRRRLGDVHGGVDGPRGPARRPRRAAAGSPGPMPRRS